MLLVFIFYFGESVSSMTPVLANGSYSTCSNGDLCWMNESSRRTRTHHPIPRNNNSNEVAGYNLKSLFDLYLISISNQRFMK